MAFDPDAYLSGGTAIKEFDPDTYLAGDTELPEVIATEGGGGFLEKINEALRKPSPAWLQAPESALRELITEQLPHDIPSYLKSIGGPVVQGYEQAKALASGDVSGLPLVGRVPEIMEAEETPAFSKERYKTTLKTLMDVGILAGAVEGPRIPLRTEPTLAERITSPRVEPPPPVDVQQPGSAGFNATMREQWETPEPPVAAPQMPATAPEAVVPGPVAEAAPPAPAPMTPRAARQLAELKRHRDKVLEIGGKVSSDVTRKIAEIEGVPQEAPVQAQEAPSFAPEAPGGVPVAEPPPMTASVPVMITRQMEADLKARGHSQAEINAMKPQEAHDILTQRAATEPPPQGAGFTRDINDNLVGTAMVGEQPIEAMISPRGRIAFGPPPETGASTLRRTNLGAFKTMNELSPVIEGLMREKLRENPAQVFEFGAGDPTKAALYQRYLRKIGIEAKPEVPFEIPQGHPLRQGLEPPPPGAGAPSPPEVPPSERGYAGLEPVTSTKNVVTAAEREARGLPPAEEAAARDFGTVWDESAKDTAAPARLVAALKVEPRALSDVENAHLLRRQIELQTEHEVTTKAVNEASDPAVAAEAKQRLETVRNDLQDVYDVGKAAGTETGRGLNARKMLADQDYALSNMEATTRALVNDGKPLSEAQLSEVAKLHERIRTAEDKLAAYESQEIFNQSLKAAPRRPVLSFLDEQAVKARERINARRTRLYADPLGITNVAHLADEAIIGASHIARGVTKFADWSAQMVTEFGDRIKPYLAALFEKSKQQFKNASAGLKKAPVTYAEREARALAGEKKGIITRTEKLKGRTDVVTAEHPFGEFEPLKRRAPRMDPEKAQLQYEYSKAKEAFDRGIYEAELKKRSRPERILGTAREVLNLPRSLLASADFSAVRRQGGIYTMIHPLRARHAFRAMMEATKSEQGYFKVTQEIKDRPNAPEYQRYGLELTDIGPVTRAKMEEQFQSRWAGKIPGISHSQRAYTAFLNHARADWFDLLKDSLAKKGEPLTPKQGKAIANAVNVFTGRGAMNQKWIGAMTALNDVFFAPRWRASRFQTLIGQPLWKNSGARGVIAKEYAKALIGYGSILTLIGWATKNTLHPMEKNPVSTEAGKLRVGNTRIDFLQGLQQPTVLLSRLFSGRTKTAAGNVEKIYGDVPLGKTTSSDIITRFLRSSLAPVPGGVWNVLEGKNVIGEPVTLPSTVRDLTIPLLGKDIYDAMKDQGVPTGTALGLLALFGDGIQTYSPRVSTKAPKREPSVSQRIKAAKAKRTRERKKGLQGQMTP